MAPVVDISSFDPQQFQPVQPGLGAPDPLQSFPDPTKPVDPFAALAQPQQPPGAAAAPAAPPAPKKSVPAQPKPAPAAAGATPTAGSSWGPTNFTQSGSINPNAGDAIGLLRQIAGFDMTQYNKLSDEAKANVDRQIAIMADGREQQQKINSRIDQANKDLQAAQDKAISQQQSMDQQLTQWAQQTPTRESFYALGMQLAAPLSLLAAIGGAVTKTNAVGLLGATNGIMEGINTGSEEKFQAALAKWQTLYQTLQDHQARAERTYNTIKEAYAGRIDAAEKASERQRQMTGDQLAPEQLKIATGMGLWNAQGKVLKDLENVALAVERAKDAWLNRIAYGFTGAGAGPSPMAPTTPLKDLGGPNHDPMVAAHDLAGFLTMNGHPGFTGGLRSSMIPELMRFVQGNPDMTLEDANNHIWQGRAFGAGEAAGQRTVATIISRQQPTLLALMRPGGIFDQVDVAAKRVADTGLTDSQIENELRGRWAGMTANSRIAPNDVFGAYITKLKALHGLEGNILSRTGQATDMTRHMAEDEFKLWSPYAYLHAQLQAAKEVDSSVYDGDVQTLMERQQGTTYQQIQSRFQGMAQQPVGGRTNEQVQQQSGLPTIRSKEEYDKLGSGQPFIGPDGAQYTKP